MTGRLDRLWALTGAATVALFALGLVFGDLAGTTNFPPLNASSAAVARYLLANRSDVRALSFFHLLSAFALVCFAVYLWRRLALDPRAAAAALAGGVAAAVFVALSAVCYRVLSEPTVARDAPLAHGLLVASYITGGPAIGLPLTLTIGATSAAAWRGELPLPRWIAWLGVGAVVFGIGSAGTMLGPTNNSSAWYGVLLVDAVLGFAWLALASLCLSAREPSGRRDG